MSMIKPTLLALAATAALAGTALAQQAPAAPGGTPPSTAQVQQRPDADNPPGDDRRPRWRADREERWGRWNRRSFGDRDDRDQTGEREHMRRHLGMGRFCGPQGEQFAARMLERMEQATKPTAEQKPAFDKLKEAATKASETIRAACPAEPSVTPPGRLASAEKRLTAMLEAIRTVRPAMEAFYGSLSDEQKARFYMSHRPMMHPTGEENRDMRGPGRGEPRGPGRPDRFERGDRDQYQRDERGDRTNFDHSGDEALTPSQSL